MSYFLLQVAFVLGTPLALCFVITRLRREGLAAQVRRAAVNLYALADTIDIAQSEFRERKIRYSLNAGLHVESVR